MKTCCFTGHRILSKFKMPALKKRLESTVENLIHQGVYSFSCGGAIGFDMLAGYTVLKFKKKYPTVKLIMILPHRSQTEKWNDKKDREAYVQLLAAADEIIYVSENYYDGCMKQRNIRLLDDSLYCIAYLKNKRSGTGQTVRMANERGITVFNLAIADNPV